MKLQKWEGSDFIKKIPLLAYHNRRRKMKNHLSNCCKHSFYYNTSQLYKNIRTRMLSINVNGRRSKSFLDGKM